ncbi:hypothetical protein, partial [Bacteroides rodentium]
YEIPFERAMIEELNCLSCRAYDSNGKLVEQTRCSGMWDEKPDEKYSKFLLSAYVSSFVQLLDNVSCFRPCG